MGEVMEEEIKRWIARRKSPLVLEIIQGKITVAAASRQFDLTPAEIEAGSMTESAAWKTSCVPSPTTYASSTSGSSRTCRTPAARRCWISALEKSWRPFRERTRTVALGPAGCEG